MASKRNKTPENKFNQGGENLYIGDHSTLRKELMRTQINGKISCSWVEIIIVKTSVLLKQYTESVQLLLKF